MELISKVPRAAALALFLWGAAVSMAAACPDWRQSGERLQYSSDEAWTPRSHSVVAGGSVDLSGCTMPGLGHVAIAPDFTLNFTDNDVHRDLEFRVEAECDTVLLVNDGDADWHFNDDDASGTDPRIRLQAAREGIYDVWVGTYGPATCSAQLVVETFGESAPGAASASGTGFVVNTDGWLVTNAHVVEGCGRVEIVGHGQAQSVVTDSVEDLAAVHAGRALDAQPLVLRTSRARLAEAVYALGYPLSGILSPAVRVTNGTVNALTGPDGEETMIQISAPIQPGNSGGPLIDRAGLVVGVTTATLSESAYARAQNVNFAVSVAVTARFLKQNGIAFASAEPGETDGGEISDVAEAAAAATVMIRCEADLAGGGIEPQASARPAMTVAAGTDVIGFDYRTLRDASLEECQGSCERDGQCRAFTYNRRHGICLLKEDAALLVRNDDAVGGYVRSLSDTVFDSGFRVRADMDTPGGDYARLRGADYLECFLECAADTQCRAFAYVTDTRDCWLKDRIGTVRPMAGVELGLR